MHAMHCMLVAGLIFQSQGLEVKSVRVSSDFHPSGVGTGAWGNLSLPVGTLKPYQGP